MLGITFTCNPITKGTITIMLITADNAFSLLYGNFMVFILRWFVCLLVRLPFLILGSDGMILLFGIRWGVSRLSRMLRLCRGWFRL